MVALRTILLLMAPALCAHAHASTDREAKPCRSDSGIDLKITLDRTLIYHGVLAACPQMLPDSLRERYTRAIFFFKPARSLEWDDARTLAGEQIEGNVWRAGTDSNAVLLGISFVNRDRVLLIQFTLPRLTHRPHSPWGRHSIRDAA